MNPDVLGLEQLEQRVAALEQRLAGCQQLAYNFKTAAQRLGISSQTLYRERRRGALHPLEGIKLIAHEELERWIRDRSAVIRPRRTRTRIDKPITQ